MTEKERKLYIKKKEITPFEVFISGQEENGSTLFGFKLTGKDILDWEEKAKRRIPKGFFPIFKS